MSQIVDFPQGSGLIICIVSRSLRLSSAYLISGHILDENIELDLSRGSILLTIVTIYFYPANI